MGHGHPTPTCPTVNESGPPIQPIVRGLTFHNLAIIISGATAVFSCLIALFLIFRHATHFSNPPEQKQIIRIITIIPSFAIISLICVWLDGSPAPYLVPALDVAESFPMAAFFLLMSTYVAPEDGDRAAFFDRLELIDKKGNSQGTGSLQWYKKLSLLVTQWIPVSIILWIATVITLAIGRYCTTSNKPHFAHIWITVFRMFSTAMAIISVLRFYKRSKDALKPRGTFKQLLCFKILVFLNFIQTFVFNFLTSSGNLHANKYLTFQDLSHGIPSLVLSCEVTLVASFFLVAYSPARYTIRTSIEEAHAPGSYQGGPLGIRAIFSALNVLDIISTLIQAIQGRSGGSGPSISMPSQMNTYAYGNQQSLGFGWGRHQRRY